MKKINYCLLILCSFMFTSLNINASHSITSRKQYITCYKKEPGAEQYTLSINSSKKLNNDIYVYTGTAQKGGKRSFNVEVYTTQSDLNNDPIPIVYLRPGNNPKNIYLH